MSSNFKIQSRLVMSHNALLETVLRRSQFENNFEASYESLSVYLPRKLSWRNKMSFLSLPVILKINLKTLTRLQPLTRRRRITRDSCNNNLGSQNSSRGREDLNTAFLNLDGGLFTEKPSSSKVV